MYTKGALDLVLKVVTAMGCLRSSIRDKEAGELEERCSCMCRVAKWSKTVLPHHC